MAYPTGMIEFALLGSMRRQEAARATTPLMMTMVPGPAAQRSALAAVAVATQAQEMLRREGRSADAAVAAAKQAITASAPPTLDDLRKTAALRDVADEALLTAINDIRDSARSTGAANTAVEAASTAVEAARIAVGAKAPPTLKDLKNFPALTNVADDALLNAVISVRRRANRRSRAAATAAAHGVIAAMRSSFKAAAPLTLEELKKIPDLDEVADADLLTAVNDTTVVVQQGVDLIRAFKDHGAKPIDAARRGEFSAFLNLLDAGEQAVLIK